MAAFVTFEDVSKVYHSGEIEIRAVDHISFTIEKGEFCVIVGPSGAGKTTVLNMLGGMDACSGGTITVDGTLVSGVSTPASSRPIAATTSALSSSSITSSAT